MVSAEIPVTSLTFLIFMARPPFHFYLYYKPWSALQVKPKETPNSFQAEGVRRKGSQKEDPEVFFLCLCSHQVTDFFILDGDALSLQFGNSCCKLWQIGLVGHKKLVHDPLSPSS